MRLKERNFLAPLFALEKFGNSHEGWAKYKVNPQLHFHQLEIISKDWLLDLLFNMNGRVIIFFDGNVSLLRRVCNPLPFFSQLTFCGMCTTRE